MRVLVTGGAGFIGSNVCLQLVKNGHNVIVVDSLIDQVHGAKDDLSPTYNNIRGIVEFVKADIRDRSVIKKQIKNVDVVIHLAAMTGTGQSMYSINEYIDINVSGTAGLMSEIVSSNNQVQRIIVASSRAIYGEGKYHCKVDGSVFPEERLIYNLQKGQFDPFCPHCGGDIVPVPTDEDAAIKPTSLYGISKLSQEMIVLNSAKSIGLPSVALRYQNVYGPGQSLINPYTGILSIFSNLIYKGNEVNIYEDGNESRDFVYIDDVVSATCKSVDAKINSQMSFNVGTGVKTSVKDIVRLLGCALNKEVQSRVSGDFRLGDIRHNYADLTKISQILNFKPRINIEKGINNLISWVLSQRLIDGKYYKSESELVEHGILKRNV